MPVVSLSDLRAHLNWPSSKDTSQDAELLALGDACADTIEGYLGRPIRAKTVVERFNGGVSALNLRMNPCPCVTCMAYQQHITITSVVEENTTLTSNDYTLDPDAAILWRGKLTNWPWLARTPAGIVVTYAWAGYTSTPPWVTLSVKRMVEHLWGRSKDSRHERTAPERTEERAAPAFLLPYMVQSLLTPHRAPGF